ncbi:MAG: prephenate dehydratase [Phycisphaerae bacterium]
MASIEELRARIDSVDDQMVRLINDRAQAAADIGRLKASSGTAVFAPDREREVLDRICRLSTGPVSQQSLLAIYRELMSSSFALERPPRVAYLGPEGSYSHEAALGKFGASVEYESIADITGVFEEIARGHVNYGVVPVENRWAGAVVDTLDSFIEHDVQICNEIHREIHQNLMARCGIEKIAVVYSKPEAFAQCQRWLAETGLVHKQTPVPSTSRAAQQAAEEPHAAAIGSRLASRLYDLPVLAANIEDHPRNTTRFFVIGRESAKPTGSDRTSLMFLTANRAGALVGVLLVFQKTAINMTMITSRPSHRADREYHFFVDIDGHADDPVIKAAIESAAQHCQKLRVLGSYPRSTEVVAA